MLRTQDILLGFLGTLLPWMVSAKSLTGDAEQDDGANAKAMTGMPGMPGMTGMPDMGMDMDMKMYFYKSAHATILFKPWHTMTWQEMLGSCIGIVIIAALYEGFKLARELLYDKKQRSRRSSSQLSLTNNQIQPDPYTISKGYNLNNSNNYKGGNRVEDGCCNPRLAMCSGWHWLQALLHMIQIFVSYCLMLVFMTYNAWLCIAVCIGAGLGYLFFGWMRTSVVDKHEHCH